MRYWKSETYIVLANEFGTLIIKYGIYKYYTTYPVFGAEFCSFIVYFKSCFVTSKKKSRKITKHIVL